ncbi:MAG: glucans biosynthesis glucosyltransferase MdoH [Reyranella sp.]|nr:glucans biosynthesis glucosyltransferase MdoH [Reyranella sp.]
MLLGERLPSVRFSRAAIPACRFDGWQRTRCVMPAEVTDEAAASVATTHRLGNAWTARRYAVFLVVAATLAALVAAFSLVLAAGPLGFLQILNISAFALASAWTVLGFWNSIIGFALLCFNRGGFGGGRALGTMVSHMQLRTRTAIAMTVRNEVPLQFIARLKVTKASLDETGQGACFDYFVLSDTTDPELIDEEERAIGAWLAAAGPDHRIVYRRRSSNEGFKPGNVRDFCKRWGSDYEFMVLLDADSLMDGRTIVRLVCAMEENPQLGILQSLIVGILPPSLFARIFEFGHRHGLRCGAAGAVWWQGDRCQFWGHNAVIRLAPFSQYCEMPYLPGKGPFSGHIICHDQIEASFMHRAGYQVRVLAEETGSYEGVPPTLLEFAHRNHRWCQGNLKNLRVMAAPGLAAIDRFHLGVVAQRFISWPAFVVFVLLSAICAATWPAGVLFPSSAALGVYLVWLAMFAAPKLLGVAEAAFRAPRLYGGRLQLAAGGIVELVFMLLLTPAIMVGATIFMIGLAFGRALVWEAQSRDGYRLSWRTAATGLWPQTLCGLALAAGLLATNAAAVGWFSPFLAGLILAIPFAVITSNAGWAKDVGLCRLPEEMTVPPEIQAVADTLRRSDGAA